MLLGEHDDLSVVSEAADGRTALVCALEHRPDIVIMDVGLPCLNGIDATKQILNELSTVKIIALSMHAESHIVKAMLEAGASAFLIKDSIVEDLIKAIHSVLGGEMYLSPRAAKILVESSVRHSNRPHENKNSVFSQLSVRQREVLQLIVEGKSMKEIAEELHLSINTVNTHRRELMKNLNLNTLADLVKYAVREGLTSLS